MMTMRALRGYVRKSSLTYVSGGTVALSALVVFWALIQVYPYGYALSDTGTYAYQSTVLSLTEFFYADTIRPPLFAVLFKAAFLTDEPAVTVVLIHGFLFVMNCVLVAVLSGELLRSWWKGLCVGLLFLATEAFVMRMLFFSVMLLSDTLYAHFAFAGSLLVAFELSRAERTGIGILGFFLLGLSCLVRPIGIAFLALWIPVLVIFIIRTSRERSLFSVRTLWYCTALVLLIAPPSFWYVRNGIVGGQWHGYSQKGLHLLFKTQELIDADTVFVDDPTWNQELLEQVWKLRAAKTVNTEIVRSVMRQVYDAEQRAEAPPPSSNGQIVASQNLSDMDIIASRLARRIIVAHPASYLGVVLRDYVNLLSPKWMFFMEYLQYKENPGERYDLLNDVDPVQLAMLYPKGRPKVFEYNRNIAHGLWRYCCDNPVRRMMVSSWYAVPVFLHIAVLMSAVIGFVCASYTDAKMTTRSAVARFSFVVLYSALFHAFVTSLAIPSESRFALPGNMLIHLGVLFLFVICLSYTYGRIVSWIRSVLRMFTKTVV